MKWITNMRVIFLIFYFVSITACEADNSSPAPEVVVGNFYATLEKPSTQPLTQELKALSPFLSQYFNKLIRDAREGDAAYLKKYPTDKGFWGNGTCVFYGGGDCVFTSYRITNRTQNNGTVNIVVQLFWEDKHRPQEPAVTWDNVLTLKKEENRWVIYDIEYFGHKITDILKNAMGKPQ